MNIRIFLTLIIFMCFAETRAEAPMAIPPKLQHFIEKLDAEKSALQGGGIAILYKGQVIYKVAFGKCKGDIGPITASTLFPLASVSKAVSATAIALLADAGKLNLDAPLKLPYLKNPVTFANILSHTTGSSFSGNAQIEQGMSRQKLLQVLKNQKLTCSPGECYRYSNALFSLAEEALNAQKLTLSAAIENLRKTLKTDGIQIVPLPSDMDVAYPHSEAHKPQPFPPYYPKTVPAAAGVFASLDALIEVFKLNFGYFPNLISQKTMDRLHAPLMANDNIQKWNLTWLRESAKIESFYGLGWRTLRDEKGKELIFHSGMISGVNSFIGFIPAEDTGIIISVNQDSSFPIKMGLNFWRE